MWVETRSLSVAGIRDLQRYRKKGRNPSIHILAHNILIHYFCTSYSICSRFVSMKSWLVNVVAHVLLVVKNNTWMTKWFCSHTEGTVLCGALCREGFKDMCCNLLAKPWKDRVAVQGPHICQLSTLNYEWKLEPGTLGFQTIWTLSLTCCICSRKLLNQIKPWFLFL